MGENNALNIFVLIDRCAKKVLDVNEQKMMTKPLFGMSWDFQCKAEDIELSDVSKIRYHFTLRFSIVTNVIFHLFIYSESYVFDGNYNNSR